MLLLPSVRPRLPDLHQEGPVAAELEDLVVVGAVPGQPDIPHVVHEDAVFAGGPLVALAGVAGSVPPTVEEGAVGVELEDRRRGVAALRERGILRQPGLVGVQAARTVDEPDVVVPVHRDPGDLAHQPVIGQHRPGGIRHRRVVVVLVVVCRHAARAFTGRLAAGGERQRGNDRKQREGLRLHVFLPGKPSRPGSVAGRGTPNRRSVREPPDPGQTERARRIRNLRGPRPAPRSRRRGRRAAAGRCRRFRGWGGPGS